VYEFSLSPLIQEKSDSLSSAEEDSLAWETGMDMSVLVDEVDIGSTMSDEDEEK